MQNGFCHPSGTFGKLGLPTSNHADVVPAINALRTLGHSHDVPIIFLRWAFRADYSDAGLVLKTIPMLEEMQDSTEGEMVIDRNRTTGFWNTTLQEKLTELRIDQLIVTGVGTNVCVESTMRDAFTNGWEVVVVEDATATTSDEEHRISLKNMQWFGRIASVKDIEAALAAV